jgi:replicative DNA helicase
MKRDGRDYTEIVATDLAGVQACLHAVESANGTLKAPIEYLKILKQSAVHAASTVDVEKLWNRMKKGDAVTPADLLAVADKMERSYSKWTPLSEVEPQDMKFVKTGYEPLDKFTGGIPFACVTIIAATPGVGKTTLALKIVTKMIRLKENKKKKAAILSLEMTMGQIHQRFIETSDLTKEEKERILMNRIFNIHELCAAVTELAAQEKLCCIMIDFADLLVEGEQTESAMGVVYKDLELLATKTEVPIILIAQLNRATYTGGLPRINHIRYSGLAEITARMIILVFNPSSVNVELDRDKIPLQIREGMAYLLVGKSNFGYKEGGPGAILVDFDGAAGWGDKGYSYEKLNI